MALTTVPLFRELLVDVAPRPQEGWPSGRYSVTDELASAARRLLGANPNEGSTSKDVAERACRACEQLAIHLARLIGDTGIRTLFRRSLVLTSAHHPWLAKGSTAPEAGGKSEPYCSSLRGPMEQQDPDTATDG